MALLFLLTYDGEARALPTHRLRPLISALPNVICPSCMVWAALPFFLAILQTTGSKHCVFSKNKIEDLGSLCWLLELSLSLGSKIKLPSTYWPLAGDCKKSRSRAHS